MREERTVLLVESVASERERLGDALEQAGYRVIECPGPTFPEHTCIGGRDGYCPLVERADVVVLEIWLAGDEVGTTSDELLELYAASGRTVVAIGGGGWLRGPSAPGHVVHLDARPESRDVVAAVRDAPEVEGLVLRR